MPPPSQELVEHELHEDVKNDQLPHIKAIEPEEESIELENVAKTNEVSDITDICSGSTKNQLKCLIEE